VPTVNGYRRIVPDANAPATATWGLDNRSVALRIPKGPAYACRLEHRVSGGDANPYLVLAAVVAGIVHGIEEPLELPPAVSRNANATAPAEARLPNSLERAVELLHRSRAARSLFGKEFVDLYCGIKSAEVRAFGSYVSPFERSAYF
jgi:glutamine synthetase